LVEFAATHEEMAPRVGANETTSVIVQLGAAERTKLPPVFRFLLLCTRRFRSTHDLSPAELESKADGDDETLFKTCLFLVNEFLRLDKKFL
jgi:hypothetical protein